MTIILRSRFSLLTRLISCVLEQLLCFFSFINVEAKEMSAFLDEPRLNGLYARVL